MTDGNALERRVPLTQLPTPVESLDRLGAELGMAEGALVVKRDDLTGLAGGGNKVRKLEYLCADAVAQGCDVLVTGGGRQSNHVRMTAAAANRLGLACTVVLSSGEPDVPTGNVVLDELLGPAMVWAGALDYYGLEAAIETECERLVAAGRRPYPMPIGGASTVGALFLLESLDDGLEIIAVFCCDLGSNRPHLFDDRVFGHGYGSISSSGVQMIGARRPALRHVSSILPRTAAFAICAQFQVSKYSMRFKAATPMWSASSAPLAGTAPAASSRFAKSCTSPLRARTGMLSNSASRRLATRASPRDASSTTAWETNNSKRTRWSHQAFVSCWCAATTTSRLGDAAK